MLSSSAKLLQAGGEICIREVVLSAQRVGNKKIRCSNTCKRGRLGYFVSQHSFGAKPLLAAGCHCVLDQESKS